MSCIDYNKVFDKVRHGQLIEAVIIRRIDHRDITIISNLYGQRGVIRIEDITLN